MLYQVSHDVLLETRSFPLVSFFFLVHVSSKQASKPRFCFICMKFLATHDVYHISLEMTKFCTFSKCHNLGETRMDRSAILYLTFTYDRRLNPKLIKFKIRPYT